MPRDYKVSLDDILEAVGRIEAYTVGMDLSQFQADLKCPIRHTLASVRLFFDNRGGSGLHVVS